MQVCSMNEKESFSEIFAKNFKQLRLTHSLSMSELALILNFKNKSTIAELETIKMLPSFKTLINIANVFAVKIDWLIGRTDERFDEAIISELETWILDIQLADNTTFRDVAPHFYLDSSLIKVGFSLADRANVIFVLQFLKAVTEKHPELLHRSVDVSFLESLAKEKRDYTKWSKKPDELYMQLLYYIAVMFYKSSFN